MVPPAEFRTYYDRPVLKEPVWKAWIPTYFFTGGLAAGSSLLAVASDWAGDTESARRARATALAAMGVSATALVADLGRRERFHHMLRVVKVSSPMSVGSWVLAAYGPAVGIAAIGERIGLRRIARVADVSAAALAPIVATYTAVLIADTAIPAWHDAYRELPFVYASGAAASAGAVGLLAGAGAGSPAARLAVLGGAVEIAAGEAMRRRLGPVVGEVYEHGLASRIEWPARIATGLGTAAVALGGKRRGVRRLGAALLFAGAALQRYGTYVAGHQSARDPKYVVVPQRERLAAAATGAAGR